MRIAEIFLSRQGEGRLTGAESVFVRASGCNLRCWYCDTPYASWAPEGENLGVEQIVARVERFDCRHVVLTGGEPMLFAELIPLCEALHQLGRHLTIETAGTLYLPVACDLMSISPKLSNAMGNAGEKGSGTFCAKHPPGRSGKRFPTPFPPWRDRHERSRHAPEVIRRLVAEYDYQFKFVIDRIEDCREVDRYLTEFPQIDRGRVMLMPQGVDRIALAEKGAWLEPYSAKHGLGYCPRRQIEWYGLVRGT